MQIVFRDHTHADTLSKNDLTCLMLYSTERKLVSAIEVFGFTSYAEAKAYVKQQTTAGWKIWAELDARYAMRMKP